MLGKIEPILLTVNRESPSYTNPEFAPEFLHQEHPGVSAVIPSYNYARYLGEAIDSVLAQTWPLVEVIVVDDGSTDDTAEVVRAYGDRVRYIYQDNAGLPAARNTGIRAAHHPFVAFLDADDLWTPEFLEQTMNRFAKLPETFGLVTCRGMRFQDRNGNLPLHESRIPGSGEITVRDLIFRTRFPSTSGVGRRRVFEEAGYFDEALTSTEDRDMWMRIAAKWRIYQQEDVLVRIRQHGVQMSRNASRMRSNMLRVLRKTFHARLVSRWNVFFWARVHAFCFYQTACMYHNQGDRLRTIRDGVLSLLVWPLPLNARSLNEPAFFRSRNLARFLLNRH